MFASALVRVARSPATPLRLRALVAAVVTGVVLAAGAPPALAHHPLSSPAATAATAAEIAGDYQRVASRGRPAVVEGALEVLHEDYSDGSGRYRYFLDSGAERVELFFNGAGTRHMSGTAVRVTGRRIDRALAVDSASNDVQTLDRFADKALTFSGTFGAQRTVVILVNFSDNPAVPYSAASARSVIFGTTSNFYLENSYGQASLTGDVFGWYTIPLSSGVCDPATLASQARAAATAAGVNLSGYAHQVFAHPSNACDWWGLGSLGGNPSQAWINGSLQLRVVGHEMGHNFGLYHSHALECGDVPIAASCRSTEYGDPFDIMGQGANHFSAFQKERLGWLNYGASPPITTVMANGTYTIEAFETPGSGPKALKIPVGPSGSYYYVELRRPTGFDSNMASNGNVMNGVLLHLASPTCGDSSELLDMTATTSWNDPALQVGQTFADTAAQLTITPTAVTPTNATVTVTVGGGGCARFNPTVALSSSQGAGVAAGTTVSYVASITNNDTANCTASIFDISGAVPAGWTATVGTAALALSPGATSTTTLQVKSPVNAAIGSYAVNTTARNRAATAYATSAAADYVVATATCTRANPAITLSPSASPSVPAGTAVSYTVTVTNRDGVSCTASLLDLTSSVPTGWTASLAAPTLVLYPGASSSTTIQVASAAGTADGSYPVNVTAKNRTSTLSASAAASYVVGGGGAPACTRANPAVALAPSTTTGVAAGAPATFTLTVTNRDSASCAASTFDLTNSVPAGWAATFAATSLSLAAGASGSTTLQVASSASTAAGSYTVSVTAKNRAAADYQATAASTYVVASAVGGTSAGSFSDSFNRPDSTAIGSAWTKAAGNLVISANMLRNAAGSGMSIAFVSGLSGATQTAAADFITINNNLGPRFGVVLRYQNASNYYLVYRQTGGSSRLLISKVVNGVETILGSVGISNPSTYVPFRIVGRVSGNALSLDFNGVNLVNVTDAASTFATGKVGIMIGPGSSTTAQHRADNFSATVQ